MKTLLNTTSALSREEIVDSMLAERKQRQEQLFTAVVAEMVANETFRRRVLDKAEELGIGKRGSQAQSLDGVRSIIRVLRGCKKLVVIEARVKTFKVSPRQAERLYKAALASMPERRIHRCL